MARRIDSYLRKLYQIDGSDFHLASNHRPKARVHGNLESIGDEPVSPVDVSDMLLETLDERREAIYRDRQDVDYGYELADIARFRVSAFVTRDGPAAVFRRVPDEIQPLHKLGVPAVTLRFTEYSGGLVLVTGPTGSGKSTTLASLLDHINSHARKHIVTIEDPVEFVHANKNSVFTQREVGVDSESFSAALRTATREDPDVVMVGELRDAETIGWVVTAAEMGFLVFATLHTNSAAKAIDRIVDACPEEQQNEIRAKLAATVKGVCTQLLLPKRGGQGRVPVNELLFATPALANMIREGNTTKIMSLIEASRGQGMQPMDDSILQRFHDGAISQETAQLYLTQKHRLRHLTSA